MMQNVHFRLTSVAQTRCFLSPLIRSLSKDVFERRTLTGSEAFSLLMCLDANKFALLSLFSLIKTIYASVSTKLPNETKSPLPVHVRPSKTLLLKPPNKPIRQRGRAVRRSDLQASSSSSPALTASWRVI